MGRRWGYKMDIQEYGVKSVHLKTPSKDNGG